MSEVYVAWINNDPMVFTDWDALVDGIAAYISVKYDLKADAPAIIWRRCDPSLETDGVEAYAGAVNVENAAQSFTLYISVRKVLLGRVPGVVSESFGGTQVVTPDWVEETLKEVDRRVQAVGESGTLVIPEVDETTWPLF